MTNKFLLAIFSLLLLGACSAPDKGASFSEFKLLKTITIDSIAPIGLAVYNNQLWISDGDNNRVVAIDERGKITKTIHQLERPMHLASDKDYLYIPEYGLDSIAVFEHTHFIKHLDIPLELDAPAGISINNKQIALADFYNHRVLYYNGKEWKVIGKKGKEDGAFHYPTDVQLTANKLYVADAYNHRIQVFDHQGLHLQTIGTQDSMTATTGIHIANNLLVATDFEQDRVLIYTTKGERLQVIAGAANKPTDVLLWKNSLYVLNYGNGTLQQYVQE
jgi:DNA-binding beta-propeller fold protein YncE